jgi:hypothetical protein
MPRIGHSLMEQFPIWLKAVEDSLETSILDLGVATLKDRDIQFVDHRSYSSNENDLWFDRCNCVIFEYCI